MADSLPEPPGSLAGGSPLVLLIVPREGSVLIPALHRSDPHLEVRAVHVERDPLLTRRVRALWMEHARDVPLVVLEDRGGTIDSLVQYVDSLRGSREVVLLRPKTGNWAAVIGRAWETVNFRLALLGRRQVRFCWAAAS